MKENKEPLLKIELDEYAGVPKVWYKGECLNPEGMIKVKLDWETDDGFVRLPEIFIKYAELDKGMSAVAITEIRNYSNETDEG